MTKKEKEKPFFNIYKLFIINLASVISTESMGTFGISDTLEQWKRVQAVQLQLV